MTLKTYFSRAGRYLVKMAVLLGLIFAVMVWTGTSRGSGMDLLTELFLSWRGWLLLMLLLALALAYPKFGYLSTYLRADYDNNKESVINALTSIGYKLTSEDDNAMVFQSNSTIKKILAVGDEKITVRREKYGIVVEGIRKEAQKAEYRIRLYTGIQG